MWAVESKTRIDRLSRNRAPELMGPRESLNGTDNTHPTKASDMYAFGVMTWEVWSDSFVRCCSIRSLGAGSHGAATILRDDGDCGNVLDAERG